MPATPAAAEPPTIRERYRAQVRQEVKQAALRQLAEAGPAGVSISAIGKDLGVSGPALYRYFASRDDLLTELAIDAYDDLAAALRTAGRLAERRAGRLAEGRAERGAGRLAERGARRPAERGGTRAAERGAAGGGTGGGTRLEAYARAYRAWALAEPHRYRLLFGPPLPGYDAHTQRLVDAAQAAMNVLLEALREPQDREAAVPAPVGQPAASPGGPLAVQLSAWAQARHLDIDPATALRGVLLWSRLHGLVSLEIAGNFASMGLDPVLLFESQLASLVSPGL